MPKTREEILAMTSIEEILTLQWHDTKDRLISLEEITHIYSVFESIWQWSGRPQDPHAELRCKDHSDFYINSRIPLSYANICELLAYQMWLDFHQRHPDKRINVVVSPSYGAMGLGLMFAKFLHARYLYTEKTQAGQDWNSTIGQGNVVLLMDELLTKGVSSAATLRAIREKQPGTTFFPEMYFLIDRSNTTNIDGLLVTSRFKIKAADYKPAVCIPCREGSIPLPLRKDGNWPAFQRQMKK